MHRSHSRYHDETEREKDEKEKGRKEITMGSIPAVGSSRIMREF